MPKSSNVRCLVEGAMPSPGYTFNGTPLDWPTLPELLQAAGVSWRIYQDPNDNWSGPDARRIGVQKL
jgi:phospholipase C